MAAGERPWRALTRSREWVGGDVFDIADKDLAPAWRVFLGGDGSPTRHLHLLTRSPTTVEVIESVEVGDAMDGAPAEVALITPPRVRRQVWLQNARGDRLGYACSWWNSTDMDLHLQDRRLPIGQSLASRKTAVFREIFAVFEGESESLAAAFGRPGPFLGRHYLFWHENRPLSLIYEVFSPALAHFLGPPRALADESPSPPAAEETADRGPRESGSA